MAFNPNFINTHMPPPNYPPVSTQFPAHQTNPCPTPPIAQQHMFNTGLHVPPPNPSTPFFNAAPPNHLPSPSPPVAMGSAHNPITSPPPMWNNNGLNIPMVNRQNHNFTNALPVVPFSQDTQGPFQAPSPSPGMLFTPPAALNNSVKNMPSNYTGLLAIAPSVSSGYNQQNINNHPSVGLNSQSNMPQFNANRFAESVPVWSNDKFRSNEPFKLPPPINQIQMNSNPNHFNVNKHPNAFLHNTGRNSIQKTNVPDSNIFQNPCAIFNGNANNGSQHPPANAVIQSNFQHNTAKMFPTAPSNMIPLNQSHNMYNENKVSLNNSAPNYNKYSSKPNDFRNSSDNQLEKRFYENKISDNSKHNNNFGNAKARFSEGQNLSYQHNNQNLIDIKVVSNENAFERRVATNKFVDSNNYCSSNSTSSIIEEYTISDSESVNNRNSPQKYQKNKRIFGNLQTVNSESNTNNFQNNKGWMTESIQKALQKRNMLFKQARTTNDPAVWDEYNRLKNEINEEIRQAKCSSKNNKPRRNPPKICQDKGKKLPFNCDTCDRGFPTKDELNIHIDLHIKCHYSGCNFEAHPKIVSLHQRMQHDTGYADVINNLQNDEEIKKWREERRRRFPTAENILKKKAEQAEKEARGEVIEEKHYGRFRKPKFDENNRGGLSNRQTRNNRYNRKRKHRNAFQKPPEIDLAEESDSEDESECLTKLPKFQGIKKDYILLESNCSKIEDVVDVKIEGANNDEVPVQASKKATFNQTDMFSNHQALTELNDDDDGPPLEIPIQKVSLNELSDSAEDNENKLSRKNDQQAGENVSPTSALNRDEKSDNNVTSSLAAKNDRGNKRERNEKRCRPNIPPRQRNSLLQMLLSDEIRHERNVIMQCVRHIVRNNFFGIETNA